MLDDYIEDQGANYLLFKNSILNNKLSHAYLIDSNGCNDSYDFVLSIVKMIFCDNNYTNFNNCNDCNKCKRIDNNNFLELKVIEPVGLTIKKEQLLELQDDFSKTSLESNMRVYIIKSCDKMTLQAANSLLKFLEEPTQNIIAFLLTDNINSVITTIRSRCQIIRLKKTDNILCNNFIDNFRKNIVSDLDDKEIINFKDRIIEFCKYYEQNQIDTIIYSKKMWHNYFNDRNDCIIAFELLVYFYLDMLKYKCNINKLFFVDDILNISILSNMNSIKNLVYKIDVLIKNRDLISCNVNLNLLIDNLIIELGGYNEYCTS